MIGLLLHVIGVPVGVVLLFFFMFRSIALKKQVYKYVEKLALAGADYGMLNQRHRDLCKEFDDLTEQYRKEFAEYHDLRAALNQRRCLVFSDHEWPLLDHMIRKEIDLMRKDLQEGSSIDKYIAEDRLKILLAFRERMYAKDTRFNFPESDEIPDEDAEYGTFCGHHDQIKVSAVKVDTRDRVFRFAGRCKKCQMWYKRAFHLDRNVRVDIDFETFERRVEEEDDRCGF